MFSVGQRVICVKNPCGRINDLGLPGFQKGLIYTVAEIKDQPPYGLFLSSHELGPRALGQIRGFRPLSDISVFTEMLTKAPAIVD